MRFTATVTIAASVERVFAYLDDPPLKKKWNPGLDAVVFEKPGVPRAVGTRFRQSMREAGRQQEYQGEVTAYRPPIEFAARLSNPHTTVEATYRLTAEGRATRVEQIVEWTPHTWPTRLIAPLSRWVLRRQQAKILGQLKGVVELAS